MSEYRVNYGNGQVSDIYTSKVKAEKEMYFSTDRLQLFVGDDHPDGCKTIKPTRKNEPSVSYKFA